MSAGGYDVPHIPSNYSRLEPRRISGSYDRPINAPLRHRSPSPGPSRRPYDTYVPHRSEAALYRGGPPNVYRPNNYRPDYTANLYSRSPSPNAYGAPPRSTEPSSWDRGSSWRPPPLPDSPTSWPEKSLIPPSPTTSSARGRGSRDDPTTRMFEPSDSWKQTHVDRDRSSRTDHSPPTDRFSNRRSRGSLDSSPDRTTKTERAPIFIPSGDRYRPAVSKPAGRPDYDSYRPQYENERPQPSRRDPVSPSNGHFRRDSGSFAHARTSDRHESPYTAGNVSRKPSASSTPIVSPVVHSPVWSPVDPPWSSSTSLDPTRRELPARGPSRSSIASTHVSERGSPAAPWIPKPSIPLSASVPPKPMTNSVIQESLNCKAEIQKLEPKNIPNGVNAQSSIDPCAVTENTSCPVPPIVKESINDIPVEPKVVSRAKHLGGKEVPSPANIQAPTEAVPVLENDISAVSSSKEPPTSNPDPIHPPFTEIQHLPLVQDAVPDIPSLEIKQPKPIALHERMPSAKDVLDLDIPPTTHSPSPSPEDAADEVDDPLLAHSDLPKPEDIPQLSSAKTKEEAARIVIMTRMLRDHQTREARVNPVLMANLSIAPPAEVHPTASPASLMDKMFTGQCLQARLDSAVKTRPLLMMFFEQRQALVDEKVARLREEYITLHERWIAHCNSLNDQQKTLASEQENQHTGRTTRRSTAITDAVRSDFEMEQIIASLGNDDATDPNHLSIRNLAKIPDMISTVNGKVDYVFDDTAHLVENPAEYFAPYNSNDDWTEDEKKVFLEKFGAHPKQFGIIADFLPGKTAAQCVEYYYLNKKRLIDFRRIVSQYAPNKRKRRGMGRKKGNGLLADIAMHDMEVNRTSGAASPSTISTRAPRGRKTPKETKETPTTTKTTAASRRIAFQFEDTPTSTPTPEPESRPKRRKATASTIGTPTASAVVSAAATPTPSAPAPAPAPVPPVVVPAPPSISAPPAIQRLVFTPTTLDDDETTESRPVKRAKRTRKIKSAVMVSEEPVSPPPEIEKTLSTSTSNDAGAESSSNAARATSKKERMGPPIQWSDEDKNIFLSLLAQYGDDFKRIASSMSAKTTIQVTNYYKSNLAELNLAEVAARAPKRSPTPGLRDAWKENADSASPLPTQRMSATSSASNSKNTGPTPPMSSLAYDSGRNVYPAISSSSYTSPREAAIWSAPPLPIRMPHRASYSAPQLPTLMTGTGLGNSNHASSDHHLRGAYSPPSRAAPNPYPYRNEARGSYGSPGSGLHPLPTRQSHSLSGSPTNPTRSPQAHHHLPTRSPHTHNQSRPRGSSMSAYTSSPPMPPSSHANGRNIVVPPTPPQTSSGSGSNAPAIIHSPTIPSPKLSIQMPYVHGQGHGYPPSHDLTRGGARYQGFPVESRPNLVPYSTSRGFYLEAMSPGSSSDTYPGGPAGWYEPPRPRGASVSSGDGRNARENSYPTTGSNGVPVSRPNSRPPQPPPSSSSPSNGTTRSFWGWG